MWGNKRKLSRQARGWACREKNVMRDARSYTHSSREPEDSFQIRWCEDVPAHHGALEARSVGLDAVEHWVPRSREIRWREEEEVEVLGFYSLAN